MSNVETVAALQSLPVLSIGNGQQIHRVTVNGKPVLAVSAIADIHPGSAAHASNAYQRLKGRLREGFHLYRISAQQARDVGMHPNGPVQLRRGPRTKVFLTAEGYKELVSGFDPQTHAGIIQEVLTRYFGEGQDKPASIVERAFNGRAFEFREDGYFNMTKAAKAYGKQLQHFWNATDTRPYCFAMASRLGLAKTSKSDDLSYGLADAKKGRYHSGTWAHPKLAVFFARWLDVEFAVWCDMVIDELLRGNASLNLTITHETPDLLTQQPPAIAQELSGELQRVRELNRLLFEEAEDAKKAAEVAAKKLKTAEALLENTEAALKALQPAQEKLNQIIAIAKA